MAIGRCALTDQMGSGCFDRDGHDLDARGLYLDVPPWGYHVFDITAIEEAPRSLLLGVRRSVLLIRSPSVRLQQATRLL